MRRNRVALYIAQGLSNHEMAMKLGCSERNILRDRQVLMAQAREEIKKFYTDRLVLEFESGCLCLDTVKSASFEIAERYRESKNANDQRIRITALKLATDAEIARQQWILSISAPLLKQVESSEDVQRLINAENEEQKKIIINQHAQRYGDIINRNEKRSNN